MIVWLTLYLGLINGPQGFALKADPAVKSVRVTVDGATVATFTKPPWRGELDFGPALLPHEITAIGFGADGSEIARASQFVNVPKPNAEVDIVLERDAKGIPSRARLLARHIAFERPHSASMKLDDRALRLDGLAAKLPHVDLLQTHVLTAEMRFTDGATARREIVFGGEFGDSAEAQLTPVAFTGSEKCFAPLHVRSIEEPGAQVTIVRDPDARTIAGRLRHTITMDLHKIAALDNLSIARLLSPVPRRVSEDKDTTALFPSSPFYDAARHGLLYLLTQPHDESTAGEPRQWADAVAVAGLRAADGGRRRAVVLVLGEEPDRSDYQVAAVRRYLAAMAVPLFVWSATGPRPDVADSWGEVEDVSNAAKLVEATKRLRRALREQRVAWIEGNPVKVLAAAAKCH